jgi:hypothetical protein
MISTNRTTIATHVSQCMAATTLTAAARALGDPAVAAAAPYDPFGNEDCVRAGGHALDCCIGNNGQWIEGSGPNPNSAMGMCASPNYQAPRRGPGRRRRSRRQRTTRTKGRQMLAVTASTLPIRLRQLLFGALFTAMCALGTAAFGHPAIAVATPSDPTSLGSGFDRVEYDMCMDWFRDILKCCPRAGGDLVPTGSERGDTVCVAPGGAGPAPGGGAGPAGAQSAPPEVVPRPGVTPPQEVATQPPPAPPIVTFTPAPANPG